MSILTIFTILITVIKFAKSHEIRLDLYNNNFISLVITIHSGSLIYFSEEDDQKIFVKRNNKELFPYYFL